MKEQGGPPLDVSRNAGQVLSYSGRRKWLRTFRAAGGVGDGKACRRVGAVELRVTVALGPESGSVIVGGELSHAR